MNQPATIGIWRSLARAMIAWMLLISIPVAARTLPPLGDEARQFAISHVQSERITADRRAPQPVPDTLRELARADYDRPLDIVRLLQESRLSTHSHASKPAACDLAVFASLSGSSLVSAIKGTDTECVNQLYGLTGGAATQTFAEAKMVTVANALRADAPGYAGTDDGGMLQLISFLRAGYYVQYYDPTDVGSYGNPLATAIRPALDAFVANAHFADVNDEHGEVLGEFVLLIDSAMENAHQLGTIKNLLNSYNPSYHDFYYMTVAVNNTFFVLFRGHQNADFAALVQRDASITGVLATFIQNNSADVGGDYEYLLSNAGREMARFLQYDTLLSGLEPKVKAVLDAYPLVGKGASIYVGTADVAYFYDLADCSYLDLCTFPQNLQRTILTVSFQCSPTLKLRAQSLTQDEVREACGLVGEEESYFHKKLATNHRPVAKDNNIMLEMVVFASSKDYQIYSNAMFGNSVNNGGIYLEGDPAAADNQARFLCYVAEWLSPFQIWNLTHEYIHYNDGRYDMYGSFSDYPVTPPDSAVWYIEGLAEYLSYSFRELSYFDAVGEAATQTYQLGEIFDNTYASGQVRIYNWGYLAARFMFENHRDQIEAMLADFRSGDYAAYGVFLNSLRDSHDKEWDAWLACFSTNDGDTSTCGGSGNSETGIFHNGFDAKP